jgi:hypothetical protein
MRAVPVVAAKKITGFFMLALNYSRFSPKSITLDTFPAEVWRPAIHFLARAGNVG